MSDVTVLKLNLEGQETWRYTGKVVDRGSSHVILEAHFNREDTPFHGLVLRRGDRFEETFFSDRWYNIFAMHGPDNLLYGWYCNIGRPAVITAETVSYVDLALDLLVYPDGRQLVLDEDEFESLPLEAEERRQALQGLSQLQALFRKQNGVSGN